MNAAERLAVHDNAEKKLIDAMTDDGCGLNGKTASHLTIILDFVIRDLGKSQAVIDYLETMRELLCDEENGRESELVEYGAIMRQLGL